MQAATRINTALFLAAIVVIMLPLFAHQAASQPTAARPATVRWAYHTETVEAASLQARLTELGNEGWNVFSIARQDIVLDSGMQTQPHIRVEKYQITGRRRATN